MVKLQLHGRPYHTKNPYQYKLWYVVRIFIDPLRGTDIGTGSNLERYVERILVPKNPHRTKNVSNWRFLFFFIRNPYQVPFRTNSYRRLTLQSILFVWKIQNDGYSTTLKLWYVWIENNLLVQLIYIQCQLQLDHQRFIS